MSTFLKIENSGVCPVEGFILLGATSKRLADNDSPYTVGQFGSGNKHALNVLLRAKLFPVVFCGNHKLEFGSFSIASTASTCSRARCNSGGRPLHGMATKAIKNGNDRRANDDQRRPEGAAIMAYSGFMFLSATVQKRTPKTHSWNRPVDYRTSRHDLQAEV